MIIAHIEVIVVVDVVVFTVTYIMVVTDIQLPPSGTPSHGHGHPPQGPGGGGNNCPQFWYRWWCWLSISRPLVVLIVMP